MKTTTFSPIHNRSGAESSPFLYNPNSLIYRPSIILFVIPSIDRHFVGNMTTICEIITRYGINIIIQSSTGTGRMFLLQCFRFCSALFLASVPSPLDVILQSALHYPVIIVTREAFQSNIFTYIIGTTSFRSNVSHLYSISWFPFLAGFHL